MKKIIAAIFCIIFLFNVNAQDRHRWGDQPYDIFLSARGSYYVLQDNFKDNYSWGAGGKLIAEWQYQEWKFSWGISLGYNRYQPKWQKRAFIPTKQLFVAQEIPITLNLNYYFFNNKVKPYVGVGLSALWGKYDYSFSKMSNNYTNDEIDNNTDEYFYRDFEAESGWKYGIIPHVGFMFSLDHRNGFGVEFAKEHYWENGRLEKQDTYSASIYYTFIID